MTDVVRKWCPAEWMDEVPPTLGLSPDDFLKRTAEGVLQLTPITAEGEDGESWPPTTDIVPGAIVSFTWHENRGARLITIQADGSWTIDEPFPDDTNCFRDEYGELEVEGSIQDVVNSYRGNDLPGSAIIEDDDYPYALGIEGWTWSDGEPFRVKVLESGAATFEKVDA